MDPHRVGRARRIDPQPVGDDRVGHDHVGTGEDGVESVDVGGRTVGPSGAGDVGRRGCVGGAGEASGGCGGPGSVGGDDVGAEVGEDLPGDPQRTVAEHDHAPVTEEPLAGRVGGGGRAGAAGRVGGGDRAGGGGWLGGGGRVGGRLAAAGVVALCVHPSSPPVLVPGAVSGRWRSPGPGSPRSLTAMSP
ncbi:MAG: hypothetical protein R2726_07475 [Acidimicrobiales bacterium]